MKPKKPTKAKDRHVSPRSHVVISQDHSDLLNKVCRITRRTRKAELELIIEDAAKRAGITTTP